jgi:hypothetical protein
MGKLRITTNFGMTPVILLNNKNTSLKAKGLFGFLQAKPDQWDFNIAGMASQLKEGKLAIREALKELEQLGFLVRDNFQNEKGQWDCDYTLYDYPVQPKPLKKEKKPYIDNPHTDKTVTVKPLHKVKEIRRKKEKEKKTHTHSIDELRRSNPKLWGQKEKLLSLGLSAVDDVELLYEAVLGSMQERNIPITITAFFNWINSELKSLKKPQKTKKQEPKNKKTIVLTGIDADQPLERIRAICDPISPINRAENIKVEYSENFIRQFISNYYDIGLNEIIAILGLSECEVGEIYNNFMKTQNKGQRISQGGMSINNLIEKFTMI